MPEQEVSTQELPPSPEPPKEPSEPSPEAPQAPRDRLQALQAELNQARASIEQNFAKELAALCSDTELEELFYEDKEAFFTKVFEIQNQKIKSQIEPLLQERDSLEAEVADMDKLEAIEQAKQAFEQANPGADTQGLLEFFMQLPPEEQAEIEALPPEQIFEVLQALSQGSQDSQGNGIPQQVQGVPSAASVNTPEMDLPTQRY